jgi:hypothetical protein
MARCSTQDAGDAKSPRPPWQHLADRRCTSTKVHPKIVEASYRLVNFKRAVVISPSSACRRSIRPTVRHHCSTCQVYGWSVSNASLTARGWCVQSPPIRGRRRARRVGCRPLTKGRTTASPKDIPTGKTESLCSGASLGGGAGGTPSPMKKIPVVKSCRCGSGSRSCAPCSRPCARWRCTPSAVEQIAPAGPRTINVERPRRASSWQNPALAKRPRTCV